MATTEDGIHKVDGLGKCLTFESLDNYGMSAMNLDSVEDQNSFIQIESSNIEANTTAVIDLYQSSTYNNLEIYNFANADHVVIKIGNWAARFIGQISMIEHSANLTIISQNITNFYHIATDNIFKLSIYGGINSPIYMNYANISILNIEGEAVILAGNIYTAYTNISLGNSGVLCTKLLEQISGDTLEVTINNYDSESLSLFGNYLFQDSIKIYSQAMVLLDSNSLISSAGLINITAKEGLDHYGNIQSANSNILINSIDYINIYGVIQGLVNLSSANNITLSNHSILLGKGGITINAPFIMLEQNAIIQAISGNIELNATSITLTQAGRILSNSSKIILRSEEDLNFNTLITGATEILLLSQNNVYLNSGSYNFSNSNFDIISKTGTVIINEGVTVIARNITIDSYGNVTNDGAVGSENLLVNIQSGNFITTNYLAAKTHAAWILSQNGRAKFASGSMTAVGGFSFLNNNNSTIEQFLCEGCSFIANDADAKNVFKANLISITAFNFSLTNVDLEIKSTTTWDWDGRTWVNSHYCNYLTHYIGSRGNLNVDGSIEITTTNLNVNTSNFVTNNIIYFSATKPTIIITPMPSIKIYCPEDRFFGLWLHNNKPMDHPIIQEGNKRYKLLESLPAIFHVKQLVGYTGNILGVAGVNIGNQPHSIGTSTQNSLALTSPGMQAMLSLANNPLQSGNAMGTALSSTHPSHIKSFKTIDQDGNVITTIIDTTKFAIESIPMSIFSDYSNLPNWIVVRPNIVLGNLLGDNRASGWELHFLIGANPLMTNFFSSSTSPKQYLQQLAFEAQGLVAVNMDFHCLQHFMDQGMPRMNFNLLDVQTVLQETIELFGKGEIKVKPGEALPQGENYSRTILWPTYITCRDGKTQCLGWSLRLNHQQIVDRIYGSIFIFDVIDLSVSGNILLDSLAQMKIGKTLELSIEGHVVTFGKIIGGTQDWQVKGNFINLGEIETISDLAIKAANVLISGVLKAGGDLSITATNQIMLRSLLYSAELGGSNFYQVQQHVSQVASNKAKGKIILDAGTDLSIIGAQVVGSSVYLKAGEKVIVVPIPVYNEVTNWGKKHYYSYKSLKQFRSEIESTSKGIYIEAGSGALLKGVNVKSAENGTIISNRDDIIVESAEEYESIVSWTKKKSSGFSGLVGGTKTTSSTNRLSNPLQSMFNIAKGLFYAESEGDQTYSGVKLIAHSVKLKAGSPERQANIALLPAVKYTEIHVETKISGFSLNFDNGVYINTAVTRSSGHGTTEIIPTIFQVENEFIAQNDNGTYTQLSAIVRSNGSVYINATNVILTAAPDMKFSYAYVQRSGFGMAFSDKSGEFAIKMAMIYDKNSEKYFETHHNVISEITGQMVKIYAEDSIITHGALFNIQMMEMHARITFHGFLKDSIAHESTKELLEVGMKLGIKSNIGQIIQSTKALVEADYSRPEGCVNAYFAAQQSYDNILTLLSANANHGISGGLWFYGSYYKDSFSSKQTSAIPTIINVSGMLNSTSEELYLFGTQIQAYYAYINTKYLKAEAATHEYSESYDSQSYDIEIPVSASISPSFSTAIAKATSSQRVIMNVEINVAGSLTLVVEGHADMRGVFLSAKSLDAYFESLLLESLQDLSSSHSWGAQAGFSLDGNNQLGGVSIGGSDQRHNSHVVKRLSAMIGEESAHIVIKNALTLVGATIASAQRNSDGSFTDHGNLVLIAGEIFAQHIYDYDKGHTLGLSMGISGAGGTTTTTGSVGGKSADGYTRATIGAGEIITNSTLPENLNRLLSEIQTWHTKYDIKTMNFYDSNIDREHLKAGIASDGNGNIDLGATLDSISESIKGTMPWFFPPKELLHNTYPINHDEDETQEAYVIAEDSRIDDQANNANENTQQDSTEANDSSDLAFKMYNKHIKQFEKMPISDKDKAYAKAHLYQAFKGFYELSAKEQKAFIQSYSETGTTIVDNINVLKSIVNLLEKRQEQAKNYQDMHDGIGRTIARDYPLEAFRTLDQGYVVVKGMLKGVFTQGKSSFRDFAPDTYEYMSTKLKDILTGVFDTVKEVDIALESSVVSDEYKTVKQGAGEVIDEVKKNAPEFVQDGLLAAFAEVGFAAGLSGIKTGVIKAAAGKIDDVAKSVKHGEASHIPDGTPSSHTGTDSPAVTKPYADGHGMNAQANNHYRPYPEATVIGEINNIVIDSSRIGSAKKLDTHHNFNDIIDNYAGEAAVFHIPTKDSTGKIVRTSQLRQIEGSFNKHQGVFEWIIDQNQVTHRRFIPNGKITGTPNQY